MSFPGITDKYITQVSEEIGGRVTKRLSQYFSRTHTRKRPPTVKPAKILKNKISELCKTGNKTSSLYMFNFHESLTGLDTSRAIRCICKIRTPSLQKKVQNIKDLSQTLPLAYWYRKTIHKNTKAYSITNTQEFWNQDIEKKQTKIPSKYSD